MLFTKYPSISSVAFLSYFFMLGLFCGWTVLAVKVTITISSYLMFASLALWIMGSKNLHPPLFPLLLCLTSLPLRHFEPMIPPGARGVKMKAYMGVLCYQRVCPVLAILSSLENTDQLYINMYELSPSVLKKCIVQAQIPCHDQGENEWQKITECADIHKQFCMIKKSFHLQYLYTI